MQPQNFQVPPKVCGLNYSEVKYNIGMRTQKSHPHMVILMNADIQCYVKQVGQTPQTNAIGFFKVRYRQG